MVLFTTVPNALDQHVILLAMLLEQILSEGAMHVLMGLLSTATPTPLCLYQLLVDSACLHVQLLLHQLLLDVIQGYNFR